MENLEANLAQQLVGIAHEPLFWVFFYVRKSYDSLDRGRCMEIIRGYRMGRTWPDSSPVTGAGNSSYQRQEYSLGGFLS